MEGTMEGMGGMAHGGSGNAQAPTDARGSQRALVRRCGWYVSAIGQQLRECTPACAP